MTSLQGNRQLTSASLSINSLSFSNVGADTVTANTLILQSLTLTSNVTAPSIIFSNTITGPIASFVTQTVSANSYLTNVTANVISCNLLSCAGSTSLNSLTVAGNASLTGNVNANVLLANSITCKTTATVVGNLTAQSYTTMSNLLTINTGGISVPSKGTVNLGVVTTVSNTFSVSQTSTLTGLVSMPGGCTGAAASFTTVAASGTSALTGLASLPGGCTGAAASFTTVAASGLASLPGGCTGATGSFSNLAASGSSVLTGVVSMPGGCTGATGSFGYVSTSNQIQAGGGVTGATGSFSNLAASGSSVLTGVVSMPGGCTGATGSFSYVSMSNQLQCPGGVTGATGSFQSMTVAGLSTLTGNTSVSSGTLYVGGATINSNANMTQGLTVSWNYGLAGETSLFNKYGSGTGGYFFYNSPGSGNTVGGGLQTLGQLTPSGFNASIITSNVTINANNLVVSGVTGNLLVADGNTVHFGSTGKIRIGYPCTQSTGNYGALYGPFIRSYQNPNATTYVSGTTYTFTIYYTDIFPASTIDNCACKLIVTVKGATNNAAIAMLEYNIIKAVGATTFAGTSLGKSQTNGYSGFTLSASGNDLTWTYQSLVGYYTWIAIGSC